MKMHSENQIEITESTVALILNLYGISKFTFSPIKQGIENTSLYIESGEKKYVLRVYRQKRRTNDDISFELEFQHYLRENGIPTPQIYPNLESKELSIVDINGKQWSVILMQYVDGESVTTNPNPELITELAHIHAQMHLLGIKYAEISDARKTPMTNLNGLIANKIESSPIQTKEVIEFIQRVKSFKCELSSKLPYGYNHLDLDLDGNVIVRDNKVEGIVDFDDLRYSPSVVCLGSSLWNLLDDGGIDALKLYLDEYEKIRPLSILERHTLPIIISFRNYEIGIIRLLLWEKDTPLEDITNILRYENDIPSLLKRVI